MRNRTAKPPVFVASTRLGASLYLAFTSNEVPRKIWAPFARRLIHTLADAILSLHQEDDKLEYFHVVDIRGTLRLPDLDEIGLTRHWLNAIHPSYERYLKVGRRIELQKVHKLLYEPEDQRSVASSSDCRSATHRAL
jgi:hypothetical protein